MAGHTYIIGHYNPSVRIIDLVSYTTYVVCVNFIRKWWGLQFKVDFERQIFLETFHGNFYLLSKFLPEICWEKIAEEILFVFRFDVWLGTRTLGFRLISQHTTYYTTATSRASANHFSAWNCEFCIFIRKQFLVPCSPSKISAELWIFVCSSQSSS